MSRVRIVMDDREAGTQVGQILLECEDVQVTVKRLPAGDYLVNERILFERKTLTDLFASIKDGRLFAQARRLATAPQPSALILQGTAREMAETHMQREAVQGALISLSLIFGIPVLRARDAAECVRIMMYAANQAGLTRAKRIRRFGNKISSKQQQQMNLLQAIPGIGPRKAAQLLLRYPSLQSLCEATAAQIAETEGIGQQTAQAIFNIVHEGRGIYTTNRKNPLVSSFRGVLWQKQ
jgi:DNA excision repair protein ERCC-4